MENDSLKDITDKVVSFRDERDWKQFHNPKDLAISISLESAELLEVFQWTGGNTEADTNKKVSKIKEELADVLIYSLLMANDLGLDVAEIVSEKIEENKRKYPSDKAYGKADKYTAYIENGGSKE